MKSRKILLLVLFLLLIFKFSFGNEKVSDQRPSFIDYSTVVNTFFNSYSLPETENYVRFNFAKQKDGWHIYSFYFLADSVLKDELFWSFEKKKFLKVNFPDTDPIGREKSKQEYLRNKLDAYNFSIMPYYGYAGWSADMIKDYGSHTHPDDTLMECLARAYSVYASELLGENTGYANRKVKMKFMDQKMILNENQLETYRYYEHKAIAYYYSLYKHNPDYITYVGDIYNKYSCENMSIYLALLIHNGHEEAMKELKPGLFDSFFLDMYRKHLACCDSNGILITNGDMDTYACLYLQEIEKFRRDVLVINYQLLFSGIYVSHLYIQYPDRQPLTTTLPEQGYVNLLWPYIYVNKENQTILNLDSALRCIESKDTLTKIQSTDRLVDCIPAAHLQLFTDKSDIPTAYFKYKNLKITEESSLIFNLPDQYIYHNDLIFLDMLNTVHFKRPIYFTSPTTTDMSKLITDYFQIEGPNYKLMPFKTTVPPKDDFAFDVDIQYQKLVVDSPRFIHSETQKYFPGQISILQYYSYLYNSAAEKMIEKREFDSAKKLIELYLKNYIYEISTYNPGLLRVIKLFYEMKDSKNATSYAYVMLKYFESTYENYLVNSPKYSSEIALTKEYVSYFYSLTNYYNPGSEIDSLVNQLLIKIMKNN